MLFLFNDYHYFDILPRYRFKPSKPVRHQQTCPVCGRKLVNTYLKDGKWLCRRCWETPDNKNQEEVST